MLICPLQETWVPYLGRHSRHKISATYSCQCVQCLHVSKQWCDCQSLGFLTCAQILMHMIAHWGCTDTLRESALEADPGRKSHAAPGSWAHSSIGPCFSVYQLSCPHPLHPPLPPISAMALIRGYWHCRDWHLIIINRFYIALFSALKQTHCARMWFYMST